MKSYTITLTSTQQLGNPDLLNHYLFTDPVYGLNFVYSATADGGNIYPYTYTKLASGGLFFPWGYIFQTTFNFATAGPFKGPYTITFSPSGIDKRYYSILKITYDFGDGEISTVERDIVPNLAGATLINSGDPSSINISHDYWPQGTGVTTYIPTITVLNGNMSANIFRYRLDFYPASIYEFDQIKLLNVAQHAKDFDETFGILELNRPENYVTNARFFSAADLVYNKNIYEPDFSTYYGSGSLSAQSSLILNLDASDPLKVDRDKDNYVITWKDSSPASNDFYQPIPELRPILLFPEQAKSSRKAVTFTEGNSGQLLQAINNNGFQSIQTNGKGYTLCFVIRANSPIGTLFTSLSDTTNLPALADTEISQVLMYDRPLSRDELTIVKSQLRYKWNIK